MEQEVALRERLSYIPLNIALLISTIELFHHTLAKCNGTGIKKKTDVIIKDKINICRRICCLCNLVANLCISKEVTC